MLQRVGRLQVGPEAEILNPRVDADAEMQCVCVCVCRGCHLPGSLGLAGELRGGECRELDPWVSVPPPSQGFTSMVFWDTLCVCQCLGLRKPHGV